ncbi:MAG: hypothetical protein ABIM30_01200 [candidate division WOR-3 bacterium]
MSKANIQYSPVARSIPFDAINLAFTKSNVQEVFEEIRKNTVFTPVYYTTIANTTQNLDDTTLNFITGSALNYKLKLPNATTLFNGQNYIIVNASTAEINVVDYGDNLKFNLLANSVATIYLQNNSTSEGIWDGFVVSGFATGIVNYNLTSNVSFTSSSTTDTAITGFSLIPVAGQYAVWVHVDATITTNNRLLDIVIYKNTTSIENSRRTIQGTSSNFRALHSTMGIISFNGTDTINIMVRINSSSSYTIGQRSLLLIRLGPEV